MATNTEYPHIELNDRAVPVIEGTTMKVVELVAAREAYGSGWSPEELQFQFPTLTPSHIRSALPYYWDHRIERDQEIARQVIVYEAQRTEQSRTASPLRRRLQARRHTIVPIGLYMDVHVPRAIVLGL